MLITVTVLKTGFAPWLGDQLSWISLLLPAIVANIVAALYAWRRGLTALAFGPNTVFIVAFAAGVLGPIGIAWQREGLSQVARIDASRALLATTLVVYAMILALGVILLTRFRPILPRRALLVPLAAICWTHLVGSSLLHLGERGLWTTGAALLLAALLMTRLHSALVWSAAILVWAVSLTADPGSVSDTPLVVGSSGAMATSGLTTACLAVLTSGRFWNVAMPLIAALALTNSFGLLENVAAAQEVDDHYRPGPTVSVAALATGLAAVIGGGAPVTVYIGHPAYKHRGARFFYGLMTAAMLVGGGLLLDAANARRLPIEVAFGAILYVGSQVGILPRRHLKGARQWLLALAASLPILCAWARPALGIAGPVVELLGKGGGLVSVAWSLLAFEPMSRRERAGLLALLGAGTLIGIVHAPILSAPASVIAGGYGILAGLALARSPDR